MSLFPMIQPQLVETTQELPIPREIQWDFEHNIPVFYRGEPVWVRGKEAVLVWAWKALHTERFAHEVYTWDYGCEIRSLIGKPYSDAAKKAEAARLVEECLTINPYITGVQDISTNFEEDRLTVTCTINTIYGRVETGGKEWIARPSKSSKRF